MLVLLTLRSDELTSNPLFALADPAAGDGGGGLRVVELEVGSLSSQQASHLAEVLTTDAATRDRFVHDAGQPAGRTSAESPF